jgi:hypothetical protein
MESSDYRIICEMVKNDPKNIEYVPDYYLTEDFIIKLMKSEFYGDLFKYIPEKYITKKICKIAIEQCTDNIKYVPENLLDKELYNSIIISKKQIATIGKDILKRVFNIDTLKYAKKLINESVYNYDKLPETLKSKGILKYRRDKIISELKYIKNIIGFDAYTKRNIDRLL